MLQELGVPVESETGRYGGYRLRRGYKLPPMWFTVEEALALALGLRLARRMGVTEAAPAIEGALAKLDRVLPEQLRARVQAVQGALAFTPARATMLPSNPATLLALTTAAQFTRRVHLRYRSEAEAVTERDLDPYGVVFHHDRWYVIGWCHLRDGVRLFRLDRVLDIDALEATFARPYDFDCVEYLLHALATLPYGQLVEVLLDLPLSEAKRRIAADVGTFTETPRGILLRARADNLEWIARVLIDARCPFRILQPEELRTAIRGLTRRVNGYARRGSSSQSRSSAKTLSPVRTTLGSPVYVA
jgi:predicted DNA-binding transcriptional regulator YafY